MDLNTNDTDWGKEVPTLAGMQNKNPFIVPAGYFDALTDQLNSRVFTESFRFENQQEFNIPEGYFENLPGRIEAGIVIEKLKDNIPGDGFTVPEKYFESLGNRITSKIRNQNKTEKPGKFRKLFPAWMNYAAAACIAFAVASAIFFNTRDKNIDSQLASIPDQEIINYLQIHSDAGDMPFIIENLDEGASFTEIGEDVTTEELEHYLNTTL